MAYIFLDESGVHKSSGLSCVALVFIETSDREFLDSEIIRIESEMNIQEFHWADYGWNIREKFLRKIVKLNFNLKAVIFKNPFLEEDYGKAMGFLIEKSEIGILVIDGKKPSHYKSKYRKFLRSKGVYLKKLITGNDRAYPLLRLADFCAGLIRSHHEDPSDMKKNDLYYLLASKISILISE